jgi:hypothetical protein
VARQSVEPLAPDLTQEYISAYDQPPPAREP